MRSGKNLGKERIGANQHLQHIAPTENNVFAQFMHRTRNTPPRKPAMKTYMNMNCERHMRTKLDHLFFKSSRSLQASEIQLLKNKCDQKRTQVFAFLMLSLEKPRLAGYMLTWNWSTFLEVVGSLAWLYHCSSNINSCGQHDLNWLLQTSVCRYFGTSYICS